MMQAAIKSRASENWLTSNNPLLLVVYLSLMGTFCMVAAMYYMKVDIDPVLCLGALGLIFGIYLLNRYTDTREDFVNHLDKFIFFENKHFLFAASVCTLGFTAAILILTHKFNYYFALLLTVGISYSYKIVPWHSKNNGLLFLRIKEIPIIKNLAVAVLWGASVFLLPALDNPGSIHNFTPIIILAFALAMSTFNNTLYNDIKDRLGDKIANNHTVPVIFGTQKTILVMRIINLGWVLTVCALYCIQKIPLLMFVFLMAMVAYSLLYLTPDHKNQNYRAHEFLCESDLLFFASGLIILGSI
ncbi:MAG: UbiA family prenyltransferase [Chitinivibrionales bacterium]|nr:UbiA family prenyltransferase [Chitinivibrionales bacterium]